MTVSGFDFLAEWKKIKVKTDKVNLGKINSSLCECFGRALIELEETEGIELVKYFLGQIFLLVDFQDFFFRFRVVGLKKRK